jgi:NAD(P)-dependent dehydrogenase (short-subunit alcohol dehydrogenase family)
MLLSNRIAVITGGARGIGRAIALKFAEEGCTPVIADLRQDEAAETLKQISDRKIDGLFVPCDVSISSQVQNMVDRVIGKYHKIDILVNDAAISPPERPFVDITEDEWDRVLAVNLKGVFLCCKAVVPHMKEKKYGKIINVGSVGAIAPSKVIADYCAAKSGVVMLSQCLAIDVADHNICVNSLLPGITRTDLHDAVIPRGMKKDEYFTGLGKIIPMGKVADPADIADVALFLASDLSRYVTGSSILASGGLGR